MSSTTWKSMPSSSANSRHGFWAGLGSSSPRRGRGTAPAGCAGPGRGAGAESARWARQDPGSAVAPPRSAPLEERLPVAQTPHVCVDLRLGLVALVLLLDLRELGEDLDPVI